MRARSVVQQPDETGVAGDKIQKLLSEPAGMVDAHDAGTASRSQASLAKMTAVAVRPCELHALAVSEDKVKAAYPPTPRKKRIQQVTGPQVNRMPQQRASCTSIEGVAELKRRTPLA